MRMLVHITTAAAMVAGASASAALAQRRSEQSRVFEARRAGRVLPLPEIERRVIPGMKGSQYLGFDFDMESVTYTLKFLRDGEVIWIYVDGRSGNIVGRTDR